MPKIVRNKKALCKTCPYAHFTKTTDGKCHFSAETRAQFENIVQPNGWCASHPEFGDPEPPDEPEVEDTDDLETVAEHIMGEPLEGMDIDETERPEGELVEPDAAAANGNNPAHKVVEGEVPAKTRRGSSKRGR